MLLMLGLAIAANRTMKHAKEIPEGFQNVLEIMVEKLMRWYMEQWEKLVAPKFVNYISTIFVFILMSNISGLFGLRPPTADYGKATTLALGLITFALIHITQFKNLPPKQIWKDMCSPLPPWLPIWFPINLISEIAVPISLSLRMFANVPVRTVMICSYGPLGKIAIICRRRFMYTLICSREQFRHTYFCMLTMTYISQNYETE